MAGDLRPKVLVLVGPTAVGKTSLAIDLAGILGGEIVSCDSRQVFKYLDIGTAKPSAEERAATEFHLIDFLEPDRFLNAFEFRSMAEEAIESIAARARIPIMTVGTGLYLKAMTEGFYDVPDSDPHYREDLNIAASENGLEHLHDMLAKIDPEYAKSISPNDTIRIVRSLELYHLTGKTRDELRESQKPPSDFDFCLFELQLPREVLYERINVRCRRMIEEGLLNEAKMLREKEILSAEMADKIVGYRQAYALLAGEIDSDRFLADFQQATRNYAKRQLTWFRNSMTSTPVDLMRLNAVELIFTGFGRK